MTTYFLELQLEPVDSVTIFWLFLSLDVYRVTSWKKQHMSGNMSYDNNGHLTVKVDGVYFIYTQMYYYDGNSSYTGFNVYIDNKRILKAIYSVIDKDKPYHTQYIGGVFKITKGQRIWVGTTITRLYYFNEFSSFFGAYMLHSLPWLQLFNLLHCNTMILGI